MLIFFIGIVGLLIGSFANVVILRVPVGKPITGRSQCRDCQSQLLWYDLVPVLSFLLLRGRCRQCARPISWLYPIVELLSLMIFISSFALFGGDLLRWVFVVILLELLLILFFSDAIYLILPDVMIAIAVGAALIFGMLEYLALVRPFFHILSIGNFVAAFFWSSILFAIWYLSRGRWLGLGDAKLMIVIGLVFGIFGSMMIFYGAIISGGLVGLVLLLLQRGTLKTKLPFGSFVIASAIVYIFLAPVIVSYVQRLLI